MTTIKKIASLLVCLSTLVFCVLAFSSCAELGIGMVDVAFMADGESYTTATQKIGSRTVLPDEPLKNGYTFDGWYLDEGVWNEPFEADKRIFDDVTVYAKYSIITYSITYEAIGGTHSNPATYTVEDEIVLSGAEHADYNFLGWYSDSAYTNEVKSITKGNVGDLTLYAKYDIDGYIVDYNKTLSVREGSDNGVNDLGIIARDSHGNALNATAVLKSGEYKGGNYVVYEITLTDANGVVSVFDTVEIPVYDVNEIDFSYSAKLATYIKISSKGEEFEARATDAFGELCDITVELLEGCTLAGGEIVSLHLVATDKVGNRVVSEVINGVQIYDFPTISYDKELLPLMDNSDPRSLFTALDSFDQSLPFEISVSSDLIPGETVVITITSTDIAGQTTTNDFELLVYDSTKLYVKLYVEGEFWDIVSLDDTANYTLPLYELSEEFDTAGWFDENGNRYADVEGVGLVTVTQNTKLYYSIIKSGYIPIFTAEELKAITPEGNYYLFADIDLGNEEWTPVGNSETPYSGTFIGQGHTVSNFRITLATQYAGFFGYVTGLIEGLNLNNVNIATTFDTYCYTGALVGYNDGGNITDCTSSGKLIITSGYSKVGGLVGYNFQGEITNCVSNCQVSGTAGYYCYIGGLIGDNYQGVVKNCSASGEIKITPTCDTGYAGGLIGYNNEGNVSECFATGNVSATSSRISYVGGFVGSNSGTITNCYATGNATANTNSGTNVIISYAGGLIGRNLYGNVTNCYATGNANSSANARYCSSYAGGLIGFDFMGVITNCFAVGNVMSLSTYESSFGGGVVGYNEGSTISNCYRNQEQVFTITRGAETTYEATNSDGTAVELSDLGSEEWIKANLWTEGADAWDFSGSYPTFADTNA